ncbi:POK19 protein, partial [Nothocercus nigrocapillus]|nr:POK19 protein [Nothocercus nigrocapillus]
IAHITGIPHSPTGQAIVERMNQTLKRLLHRQKGGELGLSLYDQLYKPLYVLSFLRLPQDSLVPPVVKHGSGLKGDLEELRQ